MSGIAGKIVAVTGASSGIGEATARLLAGRGARVVLGARRADRLDGVVAAIAADGGDAVAVPLDVARRDEVEAFVGTARERHGRLDVLVANAGVGPVSPLDDLRVDDWDAMVDVNLRGVLHGVAAALPLFRAQGYGQFVTVVSTAGLRIVPNQVVYAATKNAVRTLSEGLRQEAGARLRVTAVSPGATRTDFGEASPNPEVRGQIAAMVREVGMDPAAVARAIAFAVEQPDDVDVSEIVVRPTAQG